MVKQTWHKTLSPSVQIILILRCFWENELCWAKVWLEKGRHTIDYFCRHIYMQLCAHSTSAAHWPITAVTKHRLLKNAIYSSSIQVCLKSKYRNTHRVKNWKWPKLRAKANYGKNNACCRLVAIIDGYKQRAKLGLMAIFFATEFMPIALIYICIYSTSQK